MGERSYTAVNVTSDTAVLAEGSEGKVIGFIMQPDGSNTGTVVFRSGGSGGTVKLQGRCLATIALPVMLPASVAFADGIHVDLTGTGLNVVVLWRRVR